MDNSTFEVFRKHKWPMKADKHCILKIALSLLHMPCLCSHFKFKLVFIKRVSRERKLKVKKSGGEANGTL